ncbi:multidrug ABC transporter ATP-binding protein [Alcaligenes faecalis]|uniref:ABC transporter ATP-binding protein n=1 Tax=Alcaligenes faecalis TaxID=511 RepID=UPI001AF15835|nr:ABC transporter ATP-binding protein [Alcaligenes faecalis]QRF92131.1 multidrug ABC transporter ATP-binding protein [Alcaligenes faecalis]
MMEIDTDYKTLSSRHTSVGRILGLFKPWRMRLFMVALLIAFGAVIGVVSPFLLREIIDTALPDQDFGLLVWLVLGLLGISALGASISVLQTILSTKIGQAIMHDLRVGLYRHLQSLSLGFFIRTRTGEIQSRIANDIGGLQAVVSNTATDLARNLSVVVTTAIAMLLLDWRLALFSFVVLPPLIWLSNKVGELRERLTHDQQAGHANMSATVQETLSAPGIILSRTLAQGGFLTRRFAQVSSEVARLEVRAHTAGEWQWSLIYLFLSALPALTLLLGGWLIGQGMVVTIGTLVALIALQEQLMWPLEELLQSGVRLRTTRALFTRIFEYMDTPPELTEPAQPRPFPATGPRGHVRLKGVSYRYQSETATLSDINMDIPAGSHVAIVGPTGAGKTTLGYLLARLADPNQGSITIDGIDLRQMSFEQLASVLGVVNQEPFLLNASIAENLRFARPEASDEELLAAAKTAQIHDFIMSLPQAYETTVGERGYRFSGGEKQRLALARTILRNPPVLLLDEATSALDNTTENAMSAALAKMAETRTVISIAHRLSTVRHADRIFVLKAGRLVEQGSHQELAALDGVYAQLLKAGQSM